MKNHSRLVALMALALCLALWATTALAADISGSASGGQNTVAVTGTADPNASLKITLSTGAEKEVAANDGGAFSHTFHGVAAGSHTISVVYSDPSLGNGWTDSAQVTDPDVRISSAQAVGGDIYVNGTAKDWAALQAVLSGPAGSTKTGTASDGSFAFAFEGLTPGTYSVQVSYTDGTAGAPASQGSLVIEAPAVPLTIANVTGGTNTVTLTGTAPIGKQVTATIAGNVSGSATADGSGNYAITLGNVPAGSHANLSVACEGNTQTWGQAVVVTDPAPTTFPIIINSVVSPASNKLTVGGKGKAGAAIKVQADSLTASGTIDGNGNYNVTFDNVPAGTYNSFTVSYTDGTQGTNGTAVTPVAVTNPPDNRKVIKLTPSKLTDTTLQVDVEFEPGHEIAVSLDGAATQKNNTGRFLAVFSVAKPTQTKVFTFSAAYTAGTPATVTATYEYVIAGQAAITFQLSSTNNSIKVDGKAQPGKTFSLALSGTATAWSGLLNPNATDGTFSYTFQNLKPGIYTVTSAYADNTGSPLSQQILVAESGTAKPLLDVDPITASTVTIVGRTTPGLKVTVKTLYGGTAFESSATADSKGVFRINLLRAQPAGQEITIDIYYNNGQVATYKFTVANDAGIIYRNLRKGSTGSDVLSLQNRLKELGYAVTPNSFYDNATEAAVREFQRLNGLGVDGIAGPRTQQVAYSIAAVPYTAGGYGYLQRGDRGTAVSTLQQRLKDLGYYTIRVDGIFGTGTQSAVRAFQINNGLPGTGVADSATQTLLFSSNAKANNGSNTNYVRLARGSRGTAVSNLQSRLAYLGYYYGLIDGIYGSQTESAVSRFQSRNGLSRTGVADTYTQEILFSSSAVSNSTTVNPPSTSTGYVYLYYGCQGEAVKRLQTALKNLGYYSGNVDGQYYNQTYNAVIAFQRNNGLVADGIAGKKTQNKLYGTNY